MQWLAHTLRRLRARGRDPDAGFTVVELMVAVLIVFIALLALAYAGTLSFVDIAYAGQRQSASGLANQAMEQVRALPFSTVANGLNTTDITSNPDPNITGTGPYLFNGEQIPTNSSSSTVTPLNPHQRTQTVGNNTYSVSVYVTYAQPPNTTGSPTGVPVYRISVLVTWNTAATTKSARPGLGAQVETQSLLYAPAGCQTGGTHPFEAPCQPFFYATSATVGGALTASGVNGASPFPASTRAPFNGPFSVTLAPNSQRSAVQLEQIEAGQGLVTTSGGTISYPPTSGGTNQSTGLVSSSLGSNNDPTSTLGPYQTTSPALVQSSSPISAADTNVSLGVTPGASDTGTAATTVSASSSNVCTNIGGTIVTNGQPCGFTTTQLESSSPASLTLGWATTGPIAIGPATLASLAQAPTAQLAVTERDTTAGTSTCTAVPAQPPANDGCIHAGLSRSLGTVQLGELPSTLPAAALPPGWNTSRGLIQLSSFADSASAEAGVGAAAPTTGASGQISYWNGTGYTTAAYSTTPGTAIPAATVTVNDTTDNVQISITPNLSMGGTTLSDPAGGCTSPCTRTQATATSASPVQGSLEYKVTYQGVVIADVNVQVNLGSLNANTTYQPAPSSAP